mgnify:CR=1 FL=1
MNVKMSNQLVETFSSIFPKSLISVIQKECHLISNMAKALPDGKMTTYWMDINQEPRFALEHIVKHIIKTDYPKVIDENIVGCEWWVQVRRPTDDIVFHFDKDEGLASNKKIFQFPLKATVTYLTDCGGPTMVFDHRTTERNDDYIPKKPENGFISMPEIGKHIAFDGELFHGVLGSMSKTNNTEDYRITFLVNYWTYKPELPNCLQFPETELSQMKQFTKRQLTTLSKTKKKLDEIIPLPLNTSDTIYSIKRGVQSFFYSLPEQIERNKTFSFKALSRQKEITSGYLQVKRITSNKFDILMKLDYSKDWYWTCQFGTYPIEMSIKSTNTISKYINKSTPIYFRAYNAKTQDLIAFENKYIHI